MTGSSGDDYKLILSHVRKFGYSFCNTEFSLYRMKILVSALRMDFTNTVGYYNARIDISSTSTRIPLCLLLTSLCVTCETLRYTQCMYSATFRPGIQHA